MKKLFLTIVLSLMVATSYAGNTGSRSITMYGCHLNDNTCYVDIAGSPVGTAYGCSSNSVRWDASVASGQRWFAMISSAAIAGKKISLNISGCYQNQPAFPTFSYGHVYP